MALDLSALDEPEAVASGRPLFLKVADIDEDPDQPRTEFDLTEIRASIRAKLAAGKPPIKQPISVKPNPKKPGRWLLNDGARRFRSCQAEHVEEIPAWVDEDHDDYDQVIVNNQHDKLKAMELALFIKKKLGEGDSKSTIADRLGYDKAVITHHLALIDAPDCVVNAYRSGKTKSARTVYELRNAYERWPEQVDAWVDSVDEITRPQIGKLLKSLEAPAPRVEDGNIIEVQFLEVADGQGGTKAITHDEVVAGPAAEATPAAHSANGRDDRYEPPEFGHDQISSAAACAPGSAANDGRASSTQDDGAGKSDHSTTGQQSARAADGVSNAGASGAQAGSAPFKDTSELTKRPKRHAVSDPDRMSEPLLLVEFEGRAAAVLLNRRPTTPGLIHIRFEDGGGDQEVDAGLCKINLLTEGSEK